MFCNIGSPTNFQNFHFFSTPLQGVGGTGISGISTILIYFVEICFKDTVLNIYKSFLHHFIGGYFNKYVKWPVPTNGEWEKCSKIDFLNTQKCPLSVSVLLHLFSCMYTSQNISLIYHQHQGHIFVKNLKIWAPPSHNKERSIIIDPWISNILIVSY